MSPALKIILLNVLFCIMQDLNIQAQQNLHQSSALYEWPEDAKVKEKLSQWQDKKFGIIIHWGLYAVPGIIESWNLCNEAWINRPDTNQSYDDYKKWYWGLNKMFNPINFDPESWAAAAKDAGMKYLVFTTKHHDGFALFDTKESNFSIAKGPFATNPKADVARFVFDAFRKQGFMIGAYFSKPDWHSENFWWPAYATPDRNVNYDIRRFPWRWEKFKNFTYNQVAELMHHYGSIDILWLDGGWVRPLETVNDEVRSWGAAIPPFSQEINMPKIAAMAREAQPGILVVDRTVHGKYENYQTPEQRIPAKPLNNPWESCMTLADNWGYVPGDKFKSSSKVIHSLIEIVAKGGSLLLGIGPKPDGVLPQDAIDKMKEIGRWMKKNGEAIYSTRPTENYNEGNTWFTHNYLTGIRYSMVTFPENSRVPLTISWKTNPPQKGAKIKLLETGEYVKWTANEGVITVTIPVGITGRAFPALAFGYKAAN